MSDMPVIAWVVFVAAAVLEVGGDALVRMGLRSKTPGSWLVLLLIPLGGLMLAAYGLVVNIVRWDFSKLLGVYVAVFAAVSVLCGTFVFGESPSASTWVGLGIIMLGGMVIQFGP